MHLAVDVHRGGPAAKQALELSALAAKPTGNDAFLLLLPLLVLVPLLFLLFRGLFVVYSEESLCRVKENESRGLTAPVGASRVCSKQKRHGSVKRRWAIGVPAVGVHVEQSE